MIMRVCIVLLKIQSQEPRLFQIKYVGEIWLCYIQGFRHGPDRAAWPDRALD